MTNDDAPPFADNGDIYLHGRDEVSIRIVFENEDLTGRQLWFEIHNVGRKLMNGNEDYRYLIINTEDMEKIPPNGADYVIRDETDPLGSVRLDGKIRWRGWVRP